MAIGDIRELNQSYSQRIVLEPINAEKELPVRYPILFDKTEWEVVFVDWKVCATQTYSPVPPLTASLDVEVYIESKSPNGSAKLGGGTRLWSLLDSVQEKCLNGGTSVIATVKPDEVFLRYIHTYRLGAWPLTGQQANITDSFRVVLRSLVSNPTSIPQIGDPDVNIVDPLNPGNWTPQLLLGLATTAIIVVGAVIGLIVLTSRR